MEDGSWYGPLMLLIMFSTNSPHPKNLTLDTRCIEDKEHCRVDMCLSIHCYGASIAPPAPIQEEVSSPVRIGECTHFSRVS